MSRGPWVVMRTSPGGLREFLGKDQDWTLFLDDATVVSSVEVARALAGLAVANGDATAQVVRQDEALDPFAGWTRERAADRLVVLAAEVSQIGGAFKNEVPFEVLCDWGDVADAMMKLAAKVRP